MGKRSIFDLFFLKKITACVVYFNVYFHWIGGATVTIINRSYEASNNKQLSGYLDFVNLLTCNHYDLYVAKKKDNLTIFSETLFANFVVEHNLAFSLEDHFTKLLPKICPDSNVNIASNFACGRTKCTQIVTKQAIAPDLEFVR